jgi:hypothetical protein
MIYTDTTGTRHEVQSASGEVITPAEYPTADYDCACGWTGNGDAADRHMVAIGLVDADENDGLHWYERTPEELDAALVAITSEPAPDDGPQCNVVRPGTLGYQRCWYAANHGGWHRSGDGREWAGRHYESPF